MRDKKYSSEAATRYGLAVALARKGDWAAAEKELQAARVKDFLNYYITVEMEEYDPDYDQMLYYLGYGGSTFKKVYRDGELGRAVSPYVLPNDLIVPYGARDLATAIMQQLEAAVM